MDGIQQTLIKALKKMADDVANGKYGRNDDIDAEVLYNDVEEIAWIAYSDQETT